MSVEQVESRTRRSLAPAEGGSDADRPVVVRVVRVVVVDPRPLFRRGVRAALSGEADVLCEGEAADAAGALTLVGATRPDVVLVGLDVPGEPVSALCEELRAVNPEGRIVVVTGRDDHAELGGAVRAGATGYLLEDCGADELLQAVRVVAAGESLLSPALAARFLDEFASLVRRNEVGEASALTPREREVLGLMANGLGNRAISERLFISENTVKNHVRKVHEKLQVHSRMEAVVRAVREGLLDIT
jgi:two-component system NarL family response regulator